MGGFLAKREACTEDGKVGRYQGLLMPPPHPSLHATVTRSGPVPFQGSFCPHHKVYPTEAGIQIFADSSEH